MAAADGQSLDQQSADTQASFQAVYGGNAQSAWESEHNAAIGANNAPAASPGTAPSSLPSTAPQSAGGQQTYPGVSSNDLSAIRAGLQASSGLSIKQLDEQMREFDAQLDWQKQMWQQQGLPQLAIQQRAADLEQAKFEQLAAQATRQQGFTEEIGRRQAALAEKAQADANAVAQGQLGVAQGQLGLGQSQLGLDTLKTAATLTGPADWIKATNYARGVQQTNLPEFVNRLLTGQSTATLGGPAPGATMSSPQSLIGLANQVSGVGTGGTIAPNRFTMDMPSSGAAPMQAGAGTLGSIGSDVGYAADRLRALYAAGGQALGPQQMEGLTKTENAMFTGGGSDIGADVPGFMDQYARSRIGQTAATPGVQAFQEGGIVTQPTMALMGEAGPEARIPLDPNQWPSLTQAPPGDATIPVQNPSMIPPERLQFPNYIAPRYASPQYQFESPDQIVSMADQLGLQGQDRTNFFMRYMNPARGEPLGRTLPSQPPIAASSY